MIAERTPRILVAEDDRDHREAIAKTVEREGYGVATAGNGQEALNILTHQDFELVVTDLLMPRMNGLEFLRHIRVKNPRLPVLIMTAFGEWDTYVQAMDRGCVDYLSKPIRRQDLLVAAQRALTCRDSGTGNFIGSIPQEGGGIVSRSGAVRG